MGSFFDLHRHDEFSSFDGFGKATELAKLAKELGYTALGTSNHGNTNGLVQHYMACMAEGIKPVLGVEGYFLPKYKEKHRGYHLCLFAKDTKGYRNINELQYEGDKIKYYNPIWTFDLLKKYHEGVICTTACVASFSSQAIKAGRLDSATKYLKMLQDIFGDDLYIEIQPYKISEEGLQEKINIEHIKLGKKLGIKCIMTSDSHRGRKEDFDTYLKMHEIAGHDPEHIKSTYKDRYMPSENDIVNRFLKMHGDDFPDARKLAMKMVKNSGELQSKVVDDIFAPLQQTLPHIGDKDNVFNLLKSKVRKGLKEKGKYNKEYWNRAKEELEVIEELGFADYFLIVQDYVMWAKSQGIYVGPGRGSCCNCLVAYALGITEVDSLYFGLDFRRFLRKDKKKLPDIDMDFEKDRRPEVIRYIINKYPGRTARIASYGLYKVDNLINDLAKVCGLKTTVDCENRLENKQVIIDLKKHISKFIDEDGNLDQFGLLQSNASKKYNVLYDDIVKHFSKMYKKMRFIGTHAAGVAVTGSDILNYTSLRTDKNGDLYTNYDLNDLESVKVVKFDILGLVTMEEIGELRSITGEHRTYEEMTSDPEILERFNSGETTGVFQFDKQAVRSILQEIGCSSFNDIVAANAMNRPGPLSMQMPEKYAYNKVNLEESKKSKFYKYTKDSYGTVIYQEQIQQICVYLAGMSWGDADKVMKMIGGQSQSEDAKKEFEKTKKEMGDKFISGATANGLTKKEAQDMYSAMLVYSFNKGHACGYSLISVEEMFYKIYHPLEFWYAKLKYNPVEKNEFALKKEAIEGGQVILTPHVNGTSRYSIQHIQGEGCIMEGLSSIKGIGEKVADAIEAERKANGNYTSPWDMQERLPKRILNSRVLETLRSAGALNFNKKDYMDKVYKYNLRIMAKG